MEGLEAISFQLISNAGAAKSNYFKAIELVQKNQIEEANQLIAEADEILVHAHQIHAGLIQQEASGNPIAMNLLLTHAEDLLMSAEMVKDFALILCNIFQNYKLEVKEKSTNQ